MQKGDRMSRLIDADALERDGWSMSRVVQIDEKTMELQTRKPTDFPAVEPQLVRHGRWIDKSSGKGAWDCCSECGEHAPYQYDYCPYCGADMREENDG